MTFSFFFQAEKDYLIENLKVNFKFKDMISMEVKNNVKHMIVNYKNFHLIEHGPSARFGHLR